MRSWEAQKHRAVNSPQIFGGAYKWHRKLLAIKLQIPAGKATPAPPVGPALGQHGVNIMAFTKEFNERTKNDVGLIIPVVITVYADRSFTFITKTPPAAVLIKKACWHQQRFRRPNKTRLARSAAIRCRRSPRPRCPT